MSRYYKRYFLELHPPDDSGKVISTRRSGRVKTILISHILLILSGLLMWITGTSQTVNTKSGDGWWSAATEASLIRSGANRPELVQALTQVPAGQREGLQFLIENMPPPDLHSISANYLIDNLSLAYKVMEEAPWAQEADYVSAVNVTDRYTANAKPVKLSGLRIMVDVFNKPVGERVAAIVTITDADDESIKFNGISKGDTADMNDHLFFQLPGKRTYLIEVSYNNQKYSQYYTAGTADEDKLSIFLSGIPPVPARQRPKYISPPITKSIEAKDNARLRDEMIAYFKAPAKEQATWHFPGSLETLLRENEPAVRQIAWESYRAAPIHDNAKQDFDANQVRFENHISPYTVKTVGTRPAKGWALFIAMHGGGGTTQEFNDRQWRHMQIYYRDHPEAGGYKYVALRAPDNTWNGFYTGYAYPLIENLLRQFMLFDDIDPNKKFIMGYSHGGYGAFAIGPKMPDYFAAIHASAAAPADGASPVTLRNTVFTTMIGSNDTMYGRYKRILEFEQQVEELRGDRTDIYPVTVQIVADHPHSGLPDRDKIAEMYANVRNPVPSALTWLLTDNVIHNFFWLQTPAPEAGKKLYASLDNNKIIATTDLAEATILLDGRLVDFRKPVVLELNGKTSRHKLHPGLRILCETLRQRGDPELAFTSKLLLPAGQKKIK